MKKIIFLLLTFIISLDLCAMEQVVQAGNTRGWEIVSSLDNLVYHSRKEKSSSISLRDNGYRVDGDTDLLLHFDSDKEETGNYQVKKFPITITDKFKMFGSSSGVFTSFSDGIKLIPGSGSLFSPGNVAGDFTIEFWLNPKYAVDGEEVLAFRGSTVDKTGKIIPQEVTCTIENRTLKWNFVNFFFNPVTFRSHVSFKGIDPFIPEEWHHHMLVFHSETGLLEYYVDQNLEGVTHTTSTGTDGGSVFVPVLGKLDYGILNVGKGYTGFIDEMRIERRVVGTPFLSKYQNLKGDMETSLIDMGRGGSSLERVTVERTIPGNSFLEYYYRVFDTLDSALANRGAGWKQFNPGEYIRKDNVGRFFKLKFVFFASGEGTESPELTSFSAFYDKNLAPLAPLLVKTSAGDKTVTLVWNELGESDIEGYLVYYGQEKNNYLGRGAKEGDSPIIIKGKSNSITLHGLKNDKLYYFSLAAFDAAGISSPGAFSKEVSLRPRKPGSSE